MISATLDVEEIQDEELVRRIRAGDSSQFELLAARYASKIYGLAMRLMRNPSDAKDAVQDTFLLVYTKLDGFRSESAFGTWLYKVALNSIYMKLRQRKRAAEDNIEDYLPKFDGQGTMQGMVRTFGEDPEREAIRQQSTAAVREAIDRLPAEYRVVLVARDIAKKLDLSTGYRVVINSGPDAGESVPHLHVHLLGKRALAWPPG